MSRDTHGRIVRGEVAAFEKLTAALTHCAEAARDLSQRLANADLQKLTGGLRHCIEASTEISTWRSDPRWFALTPQFEQMLASMNQLHLGALRRGGSGVPPENWTRLSVRFLRIKQVATTLWQDAERKGVQGALLQ